MRLSTRILATISTHLWEAGSECEPQASKCQYAEENAVKPSQSPRMIIFPDGATRKAFSTPNPHTADIMLYNEQSISQHSQLT